MVAKQGRWVLRVQVKRIMDAVKVGVTGTGLIADLGHLPDYQAGADGRYRYSCAGLYPVSRGQSAADLGGGPGEQKFGACAVEEGVWQSSDLRHGRVFDVEDLAFAWIRLDNGLVMTFETAWTANLARDRVYSNLLRTKAEAAIVSYPPIPRRKSAAAVETVEMFIEEAMVAILHCRITLMPHIARQFATF